MKIKPRTQIMIGTGCALGAVGALATIGETWYLGQIVNVLGAQGSAIWNCAVLVFVMVLLEYVSNTLCLWVKLMTKYKIVMEIRSQMFEKTVSIEQLRLKKRDSGDLNSLFLSDIDVIGNYYQSLMDSFGQIVGAVAALLVCICISWKYLLISFCVLPIMLLFGELANKNLKNYACVVQQKKGATAAVLLDAIRNKNMLQSYTAQEYMIARFVQTADEENRAVQQEAFKRGIAGALNRVVASMPYIAIFIVGGVLIFTKEIQLGSFFAFAYIFSNVQSLQDIMEVRMAKKGCAAAQSRLNEFLQQPDRTYDQEMPVNSHKEDGLYLCNMGFSYKEDGEGQPVFHNLNLYVRKGTTVGFVGKSGSGKSTLLGLLTGLYLPQDGNVEYCCSNKCWSSRAYGHKMAVVFQDNYMFPTTIRENLLIGNPEASDTALWQVCSEAGIADDIRQMPQGLDTSVSELGQSLSGGQRQRICIARALLKKPEILIMDEPSASLDSVHEVQLMRELSCIMRDGIF